jgi:hypothetical protein
LRGGEAGGRRGLTYDLRFSGVIANRAVPTEKLPITTQKKREGGKKEAKKDRRNQKNRKRKRGESRKGTRPNSIKKKNIEQAR